MLIHEDHQGHEAKERSRPASSDGMTPAPFPHSDATGLSETKEQFVDDLIQRAVSTEKLLFKDEVYNIVGAAIAVHRELGPGFLEAAYAEAFHFELTERGIPFRAEVPLPIRYRGSILKTAYIVDALCYDKILVELKALDKLTTREQAQTINYLKASQGLRCAVLINFGSVRILEWKRFVL